ncbi:MAG: PspA-associated protein PspAA [Chloroflexota bacterium]|nr:MAG: hypothetical protein DLM70_19745 [Chloroflexota bacterium]
MIVRISGTGQFRLDDDASHRLDEIDKALTHAIETQEEQSFHRLLHEAVEFVRSNGTPVPNDQIPASDVVVPPEDIDLEEARRFFTDEGLMAPVSA